MIEYDHTGEKEKLGGAYMQLELGQKIRELRHRDGRTQEALADALGVTSQAISRWEANGGYPDMEMIPAIANYFGVSIDELFGYENDRERRIDEAVKHIYDMNSKNNGVNINIDECVELAREALVEFPGNDKVLCCLAAVLYTAGYVKYGEYHLMDEKGYDVYDVETHREYAEWREAIKIYEKVLPNLKLGEMRSRAVCELTQLYLNTGEHGRALEVISSAPDIYGSREFLQINACDGEERARAYSEALIKTVQASADLMVHTVITYNGNMAIEDKIDCLRSAIGIYDHVFTDGNYGYFNNYISRIYTLLSVYLWLNGRHDEAFKALDDALERFRKYEKQEDAYYTAPLVHLVKAGCKPNSEYPHTSAYSLAEDWPWWSVPEYDLVKPHIQADPRWAEWVKKTKE